jgi:hypothetical protein
VKGTNYEVMQFSPASRNFLSLLLSTLLSNTFNLCPSLKARGQDSCPEKATGKIIVGRHLTDSVVELGTDLLGLPMVRMIIFLPLNVTTVFWIIHNHKCQ